jgi:integrase
LPNIGWHTFRHSLSAWAKAAGLHIEDIKTLLRHQTVQMASEVYGRVEIERKKQLQNMVMEYVKNQAKSQHKVEKHPLKRTA